MDNTSLGGQVALISLYASDAIGPRHISSTLKNNGINVSLIFFKEKYLEAEILNLPTDEEYAFLIDLLRDIEPSILGISLGSSYFKVAKQVTEKVQQELSIPVVWGGVHPSILPEECIQIADFVCVGEGEFPMLELVENSLSGTSIDEIENLWIRKSGEVKRNSVRAPIKNLDSLPFPDYGSEGKFLIEDNKIIEQDPVLERFNITIMASRGCPYHCSYCCNSIFLEMNKGKSPPIRRRSVDNVIEEIHYLKRKSPKLRRIDFLDEVFAWDKSWAFEFSKKYREQIHLPFHCFQHPNMVNRDILISLKEAGLERIDVGIQSGSERIRREIFKRPVSDDALLKTAFIIKDLKLTPFYDYIIDNPFETEEDKRLGLELLLKLPRPFYLWMFPLIYFPNTSLTKKALELGIITEEKVENSLERAQNNWVVTLDFPWSKTERFWISVFSLTSKSVVPKWLIRMLSLSSFLKSHPKIISAFATFANNVKLSMIALKWLFEGKPLKDIFRHSARKRSHWQI